MTQECLDNDKVIIEEPETDEPEKNEITAQKVLVHSMIAEVDTKVLDYCCRRNF